MGFRRRKPAPDTAAPSKDLAFSELAGMPRLLVPDEDVAIFEGITKAGLGEHAGFYYEDELVLSHFGLPNSQVSWHNRYKKQAKAEEVADFWGTSPTGMNWSSNQLLVAHLHVSPVALGKAWAQDEAVFTPSMHYVEAGLPAQTEHRDLLIRKLKASLKLAVNTPFGIYVAAPDLQKKLDVPVTYSEFRPYGWELLSDTAPKARYIYAPDSADLGTLSAHFFIDDIGDGGCGADPDRPLINA